MPKPVDKTYKINAIKFLFYYNKCKKFLNEKDLTYLFGHYENYDMSYLLLKTKQYDLIDKMMICFKILIPYLDDESIKNLTILGGNL